MRGVLREWSWPNIRRGRNCSPWADTLTDADVSVAGVDGVSEAEAEAESVGRTEAEGVSNCSPRGGALAGDGKTAVNLGCLSMTEVSSATRSS